MTKRQRWTTAAAAVAVAAAIGSMAIRHDNKGSAPIATRAAVTDDAIVKALKDANVPVNDLLVRSSSGIVILRGTGNSADAEKAVSVVRSLGVERVANLITPSAPIDDDGIRREAERSLASTHSLSGCVLRVSVDQGVVRVTGTVRHELQKDAARSALRGIRGAQRVQVDLDKL